MATLKSTAYDRRIHELRQRTRHKVRRRLLDMLAAQKTPYVKIVSVLNWVSALFRECERLQTHGALPLAYARGLGPLRTIDRYLKAALTSVDPHGYPDFVIIGDTLHVPQMRHDKEDMARAEAAWKATRERRRLAQKARRKAARCQSNSLGLADTGTTGHISGVKPTDSSLREEDLKQDKDKSFEQLMEEAVARAEAADAAVGHECPQGQEAEPKPMSSAEITEAAYREIEAERAAAPVIVMAQVSPLRGQLTRWGYDAARAARHRFTERELALAVEKIEKARTPLSNRAGAVVATILRWRKGTWSVAA